jgi:aspartate/methionine/tyrosine aminotransferase
MQKKLSDRINNLATSQTLAMAAKTRELREEGKDIIGLSLGEPDFNTPDFIKEAAIQAIKDNYNSYTPVDGYVELKDAIINKFKRDNNLLITGLKLLFLLVQNNLWQIPPWLFLIPETRLYYPVLTG